MKTAIRVFTLAAGLAAASLAAASAAQAEPPIPVLSLSADGIVRAVPDTAIVSVGVTEQADTAGEALSRNNAAMRRLFEALKTAGIADRDVATSQFSIEPVMVYPQPKADGTQDPPRVVGYRVANIATVKIRDVAKAGDLLDQVVRVGGNQIQGISFTVDDDAALLDEARKAAVKAVAAKAALYAEAGGFTLGRILSLTEGSAPQPYPAPMTRMAFAEKAADSVPVAAGEQAITVTVSINYEILPAR